MSRDYILGYLTATVGFVILLLGPLLAGGTIIIPGLLVVAAINVGILGVSWLMHRNDKEIEDE